jgi:hypothetical protein
VQLLFEGGPWADQLLDSAVTNAPEFVAVDGELGTYRRTEQHADSLVVYEWAEGPVAASSRPSLERLAGRIRAVGRVRVQIALEGVGAIAALVLAIVTLISREWIEVVFRVDPDQSSGEIEWAVVFALAACSIGLTLAARQQWRRLKAAA